MNKKELEKKCLELHKKIISYQEIMHKEAGMPEHWSKHPLHWKHFALIKKHLKLSQKLRRINIGGEKPMKSVKRYPRLRRFPRLISPMRFPRLRRKRV